MLAGTVSDTPIQLTLRQTIDQGLKYNLGLIDSQQANASVRADRMRALATLLPDISARAEQSFENISTAESGLKLPRIGAFAGLPPTTGNFGYQDGRIVLHQSVFNAELQNRYRAKKALESASRLDTSDARDVVVFTVGVAYFQALANQARMTTAQAPLASAREMDKQISDQFKSEVSPAIDEIRGRVQHQTLSSE